RRSRPSPPRMPAAGSASPATRPPTDPQSALGVDADPAAAAVGAGLPALLAAEEREAVLAADGPELVAQPLLVRAVLAEGGIHAVAAAGQRRAEDAEEERGRETEALPGKGGRAGTESAPGIVGRCASRPLR